MTKQSTKITRRKHYNRPVNYKSGSTSGTYPFTLRLTTETAEKLNYNANILDISASAMAEAMVKYCNDLIEATDPATVEIPKQIRWARLERERGREFNMEVSKVGRK